MCPVRPCIAAVALARSSDSKYLIPAAGAYLFLQRHLGNTRTSALCLTGEHLSAANLKLGIDLRVHG